MSADELMLTNERILPLTKEEVIDAVDEWCDGAYGEFLINVWVDGGIYDEFLYAYENAGYDSYALEAYNSFLADWTRQVIGDMEYNSVEWRKIEQDKVDYICPADGRVMIALIINPIL